MKKKISIISIIGTIFVLSAQLMIAGQEQLAEEMVKGEVLTMKEFIDMAIRNDTEFEKILIDELTLHYKKDLAIPADDLIMEVKSQYDFFLGQDREEPETSVSLAKLFPYAGTNLEAVYATTPTYTSTDNTSEFTVEVSQPIAGNAFGKATRLTDKIVGLEIDVARHQIVEAYEDYLATIIVGYYNWYEAYQNLQIGISSYDENEKLLENINQRQQSNIALPIDVNKVHLQVLAKREKLIELEQEYTKALNFISKAIRYAGPEELVPEKSALYDAVDASFEQDYAQFKKDSRTYAILDLLEKKSRLEVDKEADDLLPSINLLLGYNVKGKDYGIKDEDNMIYSGVSVEWPVGDQVDKAEYETAKITLEKTKLDNEGTHYQLYTDIKDLSVEMNSEQALWKIAQDKIGLARSILEDETENYSFGKVTLNDYIDAVNVLDTNRFNEIQHNSQYKKLLIEWLRITDRLVLRKDVLK